MAKRRVEDELELARRATPVFGLARQQSVIWGVRRRSQRAQVSSRRLVPLLAAVTLVGVLLGGYLWSRGPAEPVASRALGDERWQLRDGSRILIETPDTQITKKRESNREVMFELAVGAARFDVARRPERLFRVQAGAVEVEVIGTLFRVERRGESAHVSVERGRVRVSWASGSREVSAGEQGLFPPPEPVSSRVEEPEAVGAVPGASAASKAEAVREPTDARSAASELKAANPPSAEALFATADRARAEGHPLEAAQALRQLTQRFPRNARAPLAAFSLGRLLLENLRQPAEAARAFAQARALAGAGSALAEDALAREAEALRAAGNASEAAKRAELYRSLYPNGAGTKHSRRSGDSSAAP